MSPPQRRKGSAGTPVDTGNPGHFASGPGQQAAAADSPAALLGWDHIIDVHGPEPALLGPNYADEDSPVAPYDLAELNDTTLWPANQPKPDDQFPLGRVLLTGGAARLRMAGESAASFVDQCLAKHRSGDWGDISHTDTTTNDAALMEGHPYYGGRLVSFYDLPAELSSGGNLLDLGIYDDQVMVITEANRHSTTTLLPSEY